ncbi:MULTISPECIES: 50S ribosomal protein L25 [Clostridium]|uniref:Large ribosomal subunit protein bL25 n=2 Tax=Clostridium butyricum TaxID=1492 RepID=A0AAP9RD29_CLOBU|nr:MULTISPECIES: 50S ribosomal protein L25 [Clostridium]ALP89809.1 50S ribosomal protein L25 [Clostridium butyricum]ALS16261.1 50S ribosomal protein L25 [Clostridium butyricum]ANF13424.1 50S ribosomal protein L25/general stress protein Ctc [Clostridium butyricum]AOR93493.1 50S ribosomal protein L25/general stress protein Ctc [Clostridium butyricum]APF23427.1 ribosomal protein L25, Ctc-form [Clostridium butyricum]
MEELILNKRMKNSSNSAKKERKKGQVPGIIYGKKLGNLMFEIGEMDLVSELNITGEHGVINFDLDGYNGTAIIKDIQKDALTHKVMHIDLEEVSSNENVIAEVPIKFNGKDFLSQKGVVLQSQKDSVKVSCKPQDLPKSINIDVSKAHGGSTYKLSDLEVGAEISIVDDLATVCASVVTQQFIPEEDESSTEEVK